jgi:hypothetical protein
LEKLAEDKHPSLSRTLVNCGHKKFFNIGSRSRTSPGYPAGTAAKLTSPSRSSSAGSTGGSAGSKPGYPPESSPQLASPTAKFAAPTAIPGNAAAHLSPAGHALSQAQAANARWFGAHGDSDYNRCQRRETFLSPSSSRRSTEIA